MEPGPDIHVLATNRRLLTEPFANYALKRLDERPRTDVSPLTAPAFAWDPYAEILTYAARCGSFQLRILYWVF